MKHRTNPPFAWGWSELGLRLVWPQAVFKQRLLLKRGDESMGEIGQKCGLLRLGYLHNNKYYMFNI